MKYTNPPRTHFLNSISNQNMKTHVCFAELIDNSLDAKAETVTITTKNKRIVVSDDGVGVPDLLAMTQFGGHQTEGRSTSGKFGVGGIEAICNLGATLMVETVRNGLEKTLHLDFEKQMKSDDWGVDIEEERVSDSVECGTKITITNLKTTWIQNTTLVKNLQEMFAPAIKNGKKIVVDGLTISSPDQVTLEMETSGEGVLNGKSFKWFAGIIPESSNQTGGWHVALRNRMMDGYQHFGIEADYSVTKFYGYIELLEDDMSNRWSVDKHKTACEEILEVCEQLWPSVEHLLIKCNETESIEFECDLADSVSDEINNLMYAVKQDIKEIRKTNLHPNKNAPNEDPPKNRGARTNITDGQLGDKELNLKSNFFNQKFGVCFENSDYFGSVQGSPKTNTIVFGRHHPYWEEHRLNKEIVYLSCINLLVTYAVTTDSKKQPVWCIMEEEAGSLFKIATDTLSKIMAKRIAALA
jgi:Histidine kinase-, DNA gyrase B-, and HSP90-like ATPase